MSGNSRVSNGSICSQITYFTLFFLIYESNCTKIELVTPQIQWSIVCTLFYTRETKLISLRPTPRVSVYSKVALSDFYILIKWDPRENSRSGMSDFLEKILQFFVINNFTRSHKNCEIGRRKRVQSRETKSEYFTSIDGPTLFLCPLCVLFLKERVTSQQTVKKVRVNNEMDIKDEDTQSVLKLLLMYLLCHECVQLQAFSKKLISNRIKMGFLSPFSFVGTMVFSRIFGR